MAQRKFIISRSTEGQVFARVHHSGPDSELPHVNFHSPTGFETGYGGSGPADLAASILARHFFIRPADAEKAYQGGHMPNDQTAEVITLHQEFKRDFIEGQQLEPGHFFEIDDDAITAWLKKKRAERGVKP